MGVHRDFTQACGCLQEGGAERRYDPSMSLTCSLRENRRATSAVRRRGHLLLPSLALVMLRCDATSAYSLDVLAAPWIRSSRSGGSPLLVAPATPQPTSEMGATLRSDFAILDQSVWDGKPLSYLDSAATSQKPQAVLAEMTRHLEADNANVHRGAHLLSARSTESYEGARDKVARFIGATDRREVIFTRGATEAINLVANTWGAANLQSGDEIVLSVMEHHSNLVPWQLLAKRTGLVIKYAQLDAHETLDVDHLRSLLTPRTKLVSIAHVSNTLGCVNPAAEIAEMAHALGAVLMLDACQSVPHMPVDVDALGCDFLVASGHKMCGPTGIGFLWGRLELLEAMPPWQGGGEMIDTVTFDTVTFAPPPGKFEAGTPAITQAIGLGAACDYLTDIGMDKVETYEHELAVSLPPSAHASAYCAHRAHAYTNAHLPPPPHAQRHMPETHARGPSTHSTHPHRPPHPHRSPCAPRPHRHQPHLHQPHLRQPHLRSCSLLTLTAHAHRSRSPLTLTAHPHRSPSPFDAPTC